MQIDALIGKVLGKAERREIAGHDAIYLEVSYREAYALVAPERPDSRCVLHEIHGDLDDLVGAEITGATRLFETVASGEPFTSPGTIIRSTDFFIGTKASTLMIGFVGSAPVGHPPSAELMRVVGGDLVPIKSSEVHMV